MVHTMGRIETIHCPSCGAEAQIEPGESGSCPECWSDLITKVVPVGMDEVLVVVSGSQEAIETVEETREVKLS